MQIRLLSRSGKKTVFGFAIATLFATQTPKALADTQTLIIGHSMKENSLLSQRVNKFVNAVEAQSNIRIELRYIPAKRSLSFANQGIIDGDM